MTYYELYKDANRLLDNNKIDLGEYERMIEPLNDEVQKVGKWLWQLADNGWADHICSVCGYTKNTDIHVSLGWKYCPNCGAKMERSE